MANIGYFESILSATPYNWTVPTFTNDNLRHEPTFESQRKTWTPTLAAFSGTPTVTTAAYKISGGGVAYDLNVSGTSNGTTFTITAPFLNAASFNLTRLGAYAVNNGSALTGATRLRIATGTNVIDLYSNAATGAWTGSATKSAQFEIDNYI